MLRKSGDVDRNFSEHHELHRAREGGDLPTELTSHSAILVLCRYLAWV